VTAASLAGLLSWDEASLRRFPAAATKSAAGTDMPAGVPDPQQIDDLVACLRTLR
jgi:cytochrome c2